MKHEQQTEYDDEHEYPNGRGLFSAVMFGFIAWIAILAIVAIWVSE